MLISFICSFVQLIKLSPITAVCIQNFSSISVILLAKPGQTPTPPKYVHAKSCSTNYTHVGRVSRCYCVRDMAARGSDPEAFLVVDGPLGAGGADRPSMEVSARNKDTVPTAGGRTWRAGKGASLGPESGVSLRLVIDDLRFIWRV